MCNQNGSCKMGVIALIGVIANVNIIWFSCLSSKNLLML
jgi:hypothetical protein